MLKINMYDRVLIRTLRDITWTYAEIRSVLPAGWVGEVERLRPGSVMAVKENFCICDRFLTEEYVQEVKP